MNYLNKFGQLPSGHYKSNDPVSELYYAALRYYRNLGNVPEWSDAAATRRGDQAKCSTAFRSSPTGTTRSSTRASATSSSASATSTPTSTRTCRATRYAATSRRMPAQVGTDTTVNAVTATNRSAQLQGMGDTGHAPTPAAAAATTRHYMAGLAYDANTKDIRPDDATMPTPSASRPCRPTGSTCWSRPSR